MSLGKVYDNVFFVNPNLEINKVIYKTIYNAHCGLILIRQWGLMNYLNTTTFVFLSTPSLMIILLGTCLFYVTISCHPHLERGAF